MNIMRELRDEHERLREEYERASSFEPPALESDAPRFCLTDYDTIFLRERGIQVD